ncbi:hypothetical protein [Bradyrhizobium sp. WSM1417]|uniref:hypothetical protein n=1 Tax=Bradyrhizobium sp. WSM1417 TaxID=754500 RepID=UPI00048740C3|nr:hypothetical protein [Bradyrhizobium sp. WSM1417]
MRQIQVADLTASANEIDTRMGPIPGRSSDRIANELRWAADELQRALDMLGDVPGQSLTERLQTYIGHHMVLQLKAGSQPAQQREASPTDIAMFLAGALHKVIVHIDTLQLDHYFAAVESGNQFALVIENINGEVSSTLSVATAHSMFENFGREENCPGHVALALDPKVCAKCGVHIDSLRPPEDPESRQ